MSFALPETLAAYALLGEGVWGRVYDLGDGRVLKLAWPAGGIGDPMQKLQREAEILQELGKLDAARWRLPVPALIGYGAVQPAHPLRGAGYIGWLCSTQCSGRTYKIAELEQLPTVQQHAMAEQAGRALWSLHQALRAMQPATALAPDGVFAGLSDGLSADDQALVCQVRDWHEKIPATAPQPIHGDYNISNILSGADGVVTGIVDFAEACLGWAEDDLASLTTELPTWAPALTAAYVASGGAAVDPDRLNAAAAKRALIGMIICRYRLDRPEEAADNEQTLRALLTQL